MDAADVRLRGFEAGPLVGPLVRQTDRHPVTPAFQVNKERMLLVSGCPMQYLTQTYKCMGFPGGASGKEPTCQCRRHESDVGLIPGKGKSRGEGYGAPLQYSCLESPMDRGNWQAIVHVYIFKI